MMKKIFLIFGILLILVITAMISLPFLFKDEIKQVIKNAANENLYAKVDFDDIGINLFSSFPNFAVGVENLSIVNYAPFEGDTVISAGSVNLSVDFISLISGDVLKVNSISIESPKAMIYILKDGSANYNWVKESESSATIDTSAETTDAKFNIQLNEYSITNGKFAFIDQTSDMIIAVNDLDHSGSGDFSSDEFLLDTKTNIEALTIEMAGVKYLNEVNTELDMQLEVNIPDMSFLLKENQLRLNNLLLLLDGSAALPNDDVSLNINFSSPRSDFRDIISLIPAIYKSDFTNIKTSGKMEFSGTINGQLIENKLPPFNFNLSVNNGNFQYPDLPTEVRNVNLNLNIKNNNGELDDTEINLSKIDLQLGSDPIEGMLIMRNLESGPNIETKVRGKINLENVKNAFELENISELTGIIESDFEAKGNISNVQSNYGGLNANGNLKLMDIVYNEEGSDQKINLKNAELNFNPRDIKLNNLDVRIGESDIVGNGSLNNLIAYILSDGKLRGNLNIKSKYFDLNQFIQEGTENPAESTDQESTNAAFDIPKNILFNLSSRFDRLLFDNLDLKNVVGDIEVAEGKISLKNLNMNLLNGSLSGSGYYAKSEYQESPDIEFNLKLQKLDIRQTYDKFLSVQQFTPIAKYITGNFSSNLKLNTQLDNSLTPVWNTFFSDGLLDIKSAEIKNFKPFVEVGSILNLTELSNPKLQNVKPRFEIKEGRFFVSPFEFNVGKTKVVLSGSNGLDQSIDYQMDIKLPAEKFKNQANNAISGLVGQDLNLIKSNTIDIKANIGGKIDSPKIKTSASDVATDAAEQVQDAVVAEVESRADSLKSEAEQKLKEEAKKKEEEMKKKLEEEAKKKIKKLFGFG